MPACQPLDNAAECRRYSGVLGVSAELLQSLRLSPALFALSVEHLMGTELTVASIVAFLVALQKHLRRDAAEFAYPSLQERLRGNEADKRIAALEQEVGAYISGLNGEIRC